MYWLVMCVPGLTLGVDVGWQPLPEGGMEYIIQIEPELLEALGRGEQVQSDIPPQVGDVRAYRILVGNQPVPRKLPETAPATPPLPGPSSPGPSHTSGTPGEPRPLPVDPQGHPITERPAAFLQTAGATPAEQPGPEKSAAEKSRADSHSPTPALPVVLLSIGLFASLGGNVYLGWIGWEARRRWRALLDSTRSDPAYGSSPDDDPAYGSSPSDEPSYGSSPSDEPSYGSSSSGEPTHDRPAADEHAE